MLTLFSHKASLLYVGGCVLVATIAVAQLADGQGSDQVLAGDRAHAVMPDLVVTAKLLETQIEWPITARVQKSTGIQKAALAFSQAEVARSQGHSSQALTHYQAALELAQQAGHRSFEALLWHQIGKTYQGAQNQRQAVIAYQNAVVLGRETDNHVVLGEAQADLAQLHEQQGNLKAALPLYRQALISSQKVGDQLTAQRLQSQTRKLETTIAQAAKARSQKAVAQAASLTALKSAKSAPPAKLTPQAAAPKNREHAPKVQPRQAQPRQAQPRQAQPRQAQPMVAAPPVQSVSHGPESMVMPEFAGDRGNADPEPPLAEPRTAEDLPLDAATI
ncbi:MAG: MalT-like region [Cyanobacteriota bacterium]|jgi:tetratricopeptide (TPR) repeat protein